MVGVGGVHALQVSPGEFWIGVTNFSAQLSFYLQTVCDFLRLPSPRWLGRTWRQLDLLSVS